MPAGGTLKITDKCPKKADRFRGCVTRDRGHWQVCRLLEIVRFEGGPPWRPILRVSTRSSSRRWATWHVGKLGRTVTEIAAELGCSWHAVNDAVIAYGTALVDDDPGRVGDVTASGLDEVMFCHVGPFRRQQFSTSIVEVADCSLLDVIPGRNASASASWIVDRGQVWRDRVRWATLDLSGPYRAAFDRALPDAVQVADPFHVVKSGNSKLDECRRRVQNEIVDHRGRKNASHSGSRASPTTGFARSSTQGSRIGTHSPTSHPVIWEEPVKPAWADGTEREIVRESRSSPDYC